MIFRARVRAHEAFNRSMVLRRRDKGIENVIAAWTKRQKAKNAEQDSERAEEDLNRAVDALVLAHVAMTFEVAG
jgi:hypothetical protein